MTIKASGRSSSATIQSQKKIESKRSIKNRRVSLPCLRFSFFLFCSLSLSFSFYYYLSVHLPIYLSISISFSFPAFTLPRWPFGPLHRPSIKARTQHTGASIHTCLRVYVYDVHVYTQPVGILPLLEVISNICYIMIARSAISRAGATSVSC